MCDSLNDCYKLWDEHYKSIEFDVDAKEKRGRGDEEEEGQGGGWFSSWFGSGNSAPKEM